VVEGEFKKRIKQLIPAYEDFLLEEGEEPRDTEHIFKILDEAKKEIFDIALHGIEVNRIKLAEKLLKWFGDEK